MSQIDLANVLNVHQTAVSQWETGKTKPDMSVLEKLADFFNVTVDYLLGREAPEEQKIKAPLSGVLLTKEQYDLLEEVSTLPEEDMKKILEYIEFLNAKRDS